MRAHILGKGGTCAQPELLALRDDALCETGLLE